MCRPDGPVQLFRSNDQPTPTGHVAPIRPASNHGSMEICATRVRYGYRPVRVVLQRDGWQVNQKKVQRVYNALGLKLRNKAPKRRVKAKLRDDRALAIWPNEV